MHGFPARALETEYAKEQDYTERQAIQNSLIGNGFHLPLLMAFFAIPLQLDKGTATASTGDSWRGERTVPRSDHYEDEFKVRSSSQEWSTASRAC